MLIFFGDVREFTGKQEFCFIPYPAVVAVYVTPQVEPSLIADENTNQDGNSIGINKDTKQAAIIRSFSCTKLFNFLRYMIVMNI